VLYAAAFAIMIPTAACDRATTDLWIVCRRNLVTWAICIGGGGGGRGAREWRFALLRAGGLAHLRTLATVLCRGRDDKGLGPYTTATCCRARRPRRPLSHAVHGLWMVSEWAPWMMG
jgi:hypothetical protein